MLKHPAVAGIRQTYLMEVYSVSNMGVTIIWMNECRDGHWEVLDPTSNSATYVLCDLQQFTSSSPFVVKTVTVDDKRINE